VNTPQEKSPTNVDRVPTIKSYVTDKKTQVDPKKTKSPPEVKATLLTNLNIDKPKEDKINPNLHNLAGTIAIKCSIIDSPSTFRESKSKYRKNSPIQS
jgi:hypothetical protein